MSGLDLNLTPADLLECERELYRRSLAEFVRGAWDVLEPGQPYVHGWHIDAVCEHLEAVTRGEILRLLVNIPPGTMKSLLCNVFWPAWEWGPLGLAHHRFIGASHEEGLATRDNMKMRRLVQSEWFQERWPTPLTGDQNAKTYFENTATGWRQSCPVKSMTGKRGDRVIWDDPHSVEGSLSEADRATAVRVFNETLPTRLNNPDRSAIVVIMQRLHENDISGHILTHDFGYVHLCLPMEFEPDRRCCTPIGFIDPRTEPEELLFPERFPRDVVERDKRVLGSNGTAGQYQQRPSPRGGGIFKEAWFGWYKIPPKIKHRIIYADTAQKTKEGNDFSVFQCWGITFDGRLVLLDQLRGKWESPELRKHAAAFWAKHKAIKDLGVLRAVKVEDKSSGTDLIQSIKREGVPIIGIPRNRDKVSRANDAAPYVEAGLVLLPEPDRAPWVSDFLREVAQFPNAANDDQVDPMMDAIVDNLGASVVDYSAIV